MSTETIDSIYIAFLAMIFHHFIKTFHFQKKSLSTIVKMSKLNFFLYNSLYVVVCLESKNRGLHFNLMINIQVFACVLFLFKYHFEKCVCVYKKYMYQICNQFVEPLQCVFVFVVVVPFPPQKKVNKFAFRYLKFIMCDIIFFNWILLVKTFFFLIFVIYCSLSQNTISFYQNFIVDQKRVLQNTSMFRHKRHSLTSLNSE